VTALRGSQREPWRRATLIWPAGVVECHVYQTIIGKPVTSGRSVTNAQAGGSSALAFDGATLVLSPSANRIGRLEGLGRKRPRACVCRAPSSPFSTFVRVDPDVMVPPGQFFDQPAGCCVADPNRTTRLRCCGHRRTSPRSDRRRDDTTTERGRAGRRWPESWADGRRAVDGARAGGRARTRVPRSVHRRLLYRGLRPSPAK
jgi:hypothetical protein